MLKQQTRLYVLISILGFTVCSLAVGWFVITQTDYFHVTQATRLQAEAGHGDAFAQHKLGIAYATGAYNLPKDAERAAYWYKKSATHDLASSQNSLAVSYELGEGVLQNNSEALKLYRQAASLGNADAQANLGRLYEFGLGIVDQDYEKAVEWYLKAVAQGHSAAQVNLAGMYLRGLAVEKDAFKAGELYVLASKQNQKDALNVIEISKAACPERKTFGSLLKLSTNEIDHCLISAAAGDHYALLFAGQIFYWGHGVDRDVSRGRELTKKAAEEGYEPAKAALPVVSNPEKTKKILEQEK